jgi:hypothetical protein
MLYTTSSNKETTMTDDAFQVDPTPDGPDKDANEQQLQGILKEYKKAMEEEWETNENYKDGKLTPVQIREKTKELLTGAVPKAVAVMLHIAQHGKSETNRMNAAKYIIDKAVGKEIGALVGDPLEALLASMDAAKEESQPS